MMTVYVSVGAIVVLMLGYEMILQQERKELNRRLKEVMDAAEAERKDLYNRLMAKNTGEYKALSQESKPSSKPNNFLKANLEEADRLQDE